MSVLDKLFKKPGIEKKIRSDMGKLIQTLEGAGISFKELDAEPDAKQIELPTAEAIAERFGEVMLAMIEGELPENAAEIAMALAEDAILIFEAALPVEEDVEDEAVVDGEEDEADMTNEAEVKARKADAKLKQQLMTALVSTNKEIDDLMAVVVDDLGDATKAVSGVAKRVDGVAETVDANTILLTTIVAEVKALKNEQIKNARDTKFIRGRIASTANGRGRASDSVETEVEEADANLPEEIKSAGLLPGTPLTGDLLPLPKR